MRVTHVITRLVVGGAQENTVATVLGLQGRAGIDVDLISGPTTGPEGSLEPAFSPFPGILTIVPELVRPVHPWKDLLALRHLTKMLHERHPDVVHTHSGKAGVLGRLAARRARVPIVIHHIHGPSFGSFQGPIANGVFTIAERIAAKATTHFVCSANAMTRLYLAAGIGKPGMYTRVFSGFKVEPFLKAQANPSLRARLGIPQDAFVIGKIARLFPLKGHEDLLQCLKLLLPEFPSAYLLFVGGGSLHAGLEARTRELKVEKKVVFTGLVPPDEVPHYVSIMDCLAHLSSREALSRALPQALAGGKPVVAYDFDGADEICLEGETGFLVPTGDVQTATRHLLELARNPDLRRRFGERGREFVSQNFRVEQMVDTLQELYTRLLNQKGSACSSTEPTPHCPRK